MFVVGCFESLCAGQFANQVLGLVDHDWQALRAKLVSLATVFEAQERDFLRITAAVQAGFLRHGFLLMGKMIEYTRANQKNL
jgi:hypothetical protein